MKVDIKVYGCDDTTRVKLDVTPEQYKFLVTLATLITSTSSYACMPTMEVTLMPDSNLGSVPSEPPKENA